MNNYLEEERMKIVKEKTKELIKNMEE